MGGKRYICPFCGEVVTEEEGEQVCDCGCPSCRQAFELTDFEFEEDE